MKGRTVLAAIGVLLIAFGTAYWLRTASHSGVSTPISTGSPGGRLVVTYRTELKTFNRYISDSVIDNVLFAQLTQASLVRLNRTTGELEPRLATSWTPSDDGLTWTLRLRPDVRFSDGTPFTAADVLFSFQVLYHPDVKSPLGNTIRIGDEPLSVRALDAHTLILTLPSPYAPGLALLDALPILPRHKLQPALEAGTFPQAWNTSTPPSEIVGLGPFVLEEYAPGRRMVFARNPHFWRTDDEGRRLPYVDAIEMQIVPDQNAEMIRLQAGEVDLVTDKIRPEDVAALETLRAQGRIALADAGVSISPEMLWFNLNSDLAPADRPWLQRDELRLAISHAIDRQALVNTVYLGAAQPIYGPITPGHGGWFVPDLPRTGHDPGRARELLASLGLEDRDGNGTVEDERGRAARFSIITQKGHTIRERTAAVVQQHLTRVGLTVDVAAIERNAVTARWAAGEYDAILFAVEFDAFDPARHLQFWLSSGQMHFWRPGQPVPATAWEARIDDLMRRQASTLDAGERRRLFAEVQREYAAHLPVIYFAAPRVLVAMSARLRGATPSVLAPPILWNAEMLSLAPDAAARQ